MNRARLEHLCDVLDAVDPQHFNLNTWATSECGTTACAIGHAALDPAFQADGFTLQAYWAPFFGRKGYRYSKTLADVRFSRARGPDVPMYAGQKGWPAVQIFFGLTEKQAEWLFYIGSYPQPLEQTPAGVAARIRELIAQADVPKMEPEIVKALETTP